MVLAVPVMKTNKAFTCALCLTVSQEVKEAEEEEEVVLPHSVESVEEVLVIHHHHHHRQQWLLTQLECVAGPQMGSLRLCWPLGSLLRLLRLRLLRIRLRPI